MKLLLSLLFAVNIFAQSGLYVEGSLGSSMPSEITLEQASYTYDYGYSGALSLGYQMNDWKFEVEGIYLQNEITAYNISSSYSVSGDIIREYGLVNVYHNWYNSSNLVTSIGLGLGMAQIAVNDLMIATTPFEVQSSSALSYQGVLNIGYMIDESFTLGGKLRYLESLTQDNKRIADTLLGLYTSYLF